MSQYAVVLVGAAAAPVVVVVVVRVVAGPPRMGLGPGENWLKIFTKSERLILSCRVTWAWSEKVNLYG
jgi:hypothetical protein